MEMIKTQNPGGASQREKLARMLNEMLANSVDLYSHAKQAHWNVRGPQFERIHELFDSVSQKALEAADEFAERAGQLGSSVSGTLADTTNATTLPKYELDIASAESHIKALLKSMRAYCQSTREAIKLADDNDDPLTADICTEFGREMEKLLWFVESHITAVPEEVKPAHRTGRTVSRAAAG